MLKWIGKEKGAWGLPNIPARDMSDDELKERGLDKKALIETGLYIEEKPKKKFFSGLRKFIKKDKDKDSQ